MPSERLAVSSVGEEAVVIPRPPKKPKLIVLVGLSGSGKSTLAYKWALERPKTIRVNRDNIRIMLHGREWYPKREREVTMAEDMLVRGYLDDGYNVIVDATNLHPKNQDRWKVLANRVGAELVIEDLKVDLDECIRRVENRAGQPGVTRLVVERQALKYGRVPWPTDKKIVIVDVDGTLADLSHRVTYLTKGPCPECNGTGDGKSVAGGWAGYHDEPCTRCKGTKVVRKDYDQFYSEENVLRDEPVEAVIKIVQAYSEDHHIVIVSGRPLDRCGKATMAWLHFHGVPYNRIFMRDAGDFRPDYEVKNEILAWMLQSLPKEQIAFAVDDRLSVIEKVWRANGIRCIPVRCREEDLA